MNKEAIRILKLAIEDSKKHIRFCFDFKGIEELNKAIKELEKQQNDCRSCKKWDVCPCGKKGHENGTSLGYSVGECREYEKQPCDDCISRKVVEQITWEEPSYTDALNAITEVRDKIRQLPSVTSQPKVGRWIKTSLAPVSGGDFNRGFKCNICNYVIVMCDFNYCPNCGARMAQPDQ